MFTSLPTPPPTPPWEGMHPLVVHFPIALLLFAAVFVLLAAITPIRGWWFSVSALLLLIGGTGGAFVSLSTGEAAMNVAEGDGENEDEMWEVMDEHQAKMEQVSKYFAALTAIYAGLVFLPLLFKSLRGMKFAFPANLVFLAALMGANLLLANGAHLGGRLVHEFGVRSTIAPEVDVDATQEAAEESGEEGEGEAGEAEAKSEEPAAEGDMEAPAEEATEAAPPAEAKQESAVTTEEKQAAPETAAPSADPPNETPAAEPKPEAPAGDAAKEAPAAAPTPEAPAAEPKAEAPSSEPAPDAAAGN